MKEKGLLIVAALFCSLFASSVSAEDIFYCQLPETQFFSVLDCTDACKANCQLEEGDNGYYICYEKAKSYLESKCTCNGNKGKYVACLNPKFNRLRVAMKNLEALKLIEQGSAQQLRSWVTAQVKACK